MKFDLFISYARADNDPDWISAFIESLKDRHRVFTGRELNVFFDRHEILNGDQWRHRILGALRDSAYMLTVVSPRYFVSEACRWEFEEFASREFERFAVGEAIGPIYWITVKGFPDEASPDPWVASLSSRNLTPIPVRKWQDGLEQSLYERDLSSKLAERVDDFARAIRERIDRRDCAAASPTNLGRVSPKFVGRTKELIAVHRSLAFGALGAVTCLQGIGGIGKTELALAYSMAYAHEYPGGRWLVRCNGRTSLTGAIADALALLWGIPPLSVTVCEEARWSKFLIELNSRGKALFVLDNASERPFLSSDQIQNLPGSDQAAFLVTTRIAYQQRPSELEVVDLSQLAVEDGVAMLRRFRQEADSATDRELLRQIVEKVQGHALSLEVIGVFLRENPGYGLSEYADWLSKDAMAALAVLADDPERSKTRHGEVLVGSLLKPTLTRLEEKSPLAMEIARYAAYLPPDAVYEPWLRKLTGYSEKPEDPQWKTAIQMLSENLLLRFNGEMGRMHRIVGYVLRDPTEKGRRTHRQKKIEMELGRRARWLAEASIVEAGELDAFESWASELATLYAFQEDPEQGTVRDFVGLSICITNALPAIRLLTAWRRSAASISLCFNLWAAFIQGTAPDYPSYLHEQLRLCIAIAAADVGGFDLALDHIKVAESFVFKRLRKIPHTPQTFHRSCEMILARGQLELAAGNAETALARAKLGINIAEDCCRRFVSRLQSEVDRARLYLLAIDALRVHGEADEARAFAAAALVYAGLAVKRLSGWRKLFAGQRVAQDLIDCSLDINLRNCQIRLNSAEVEEAMTDAAWIIDFRKEQVTTISKSPQRLHDLADCQILLGDCQLAHGEGEAAQATYQQALDTSSESRQVFGDSPSAIIDYAKVCLRLAASYPANSASTTQLVSDGLKAIALASGRFGVWNELVTLREQLEHIAVVASGDRVTNL